MRIVESTGYLIYEELPAQKTDSRVTVPIGRVKKEATFSGVPASWLAIMPGVDLDGRLGTTPREHHGALDPSGDNKMLSRLVRYRETLQSVRLPVRVDADPPD